MRKYLAIVVIIALMATIFLPFPASGARRRARGPSLVAQLQARINELTDLANQRLVQIQQLQNDVAFRDRIIAELRTRLAGTGAPVASGLTILNSTGRLNSLGYYEVNGEVQNNTGSAIEYPKIVATFYDASGAAIANNFTYAMVKPLQPGQRAPFTLFNLESTVSGRIVRYELQTSY